MPAITIEQPSQTDIDAIHTVLKETYWSPGIPRDVVARACANSMCAVARDENGKLIGFARLVTDKATFAWLCDVIVLPGKQGKGLGRALVQTFQDSRNFRACVVGCSAPRMRTASTSRSAFHRSQRRSGSWKSKTPTLRTAGVMSCRAHRVRARQRPSNALDFSRRPSPMSCWGFLAALSEAAVRSRCARSARAAYLMGRASCLYRRLCDERMA